MDISKAQSIHFIGIGGIGTSSIAQILKSKGKKISGSDIVPSNITKNLKLSGIEVRIGHDAKNIHKNHDLIIYSPAIPSSNPELKQAKKLAISTLSYPQALGELTKEYITIAIAGSHGKSTTTAMTALIAEKAKLDPTVVIGTKIRQFKNKNYRTGNGKHLIIEACEYKRSFLNIYPDILIITNIDLDHLDYYKDLNDYKSAFIDLAKKVSSNGFIIINEAEKHLKEIASHSKAKTVTWAENKIEKLHLKPKVPGRFNITNARNAAIAGRLIGIEDKIICSTISHFNGTWRRMEHKHKKGYNCTFIDDYGHHPTEIQSTLLAIREQNPKSNILCIFQPHQYSRTRLLLKDFGKSFHEVDNVIIPNIYKVRDSEEEVLKISTDDLVNEINKNSNHKKAFNGNGLEKTAEYIKKHHKKYDIIVTMGAGNIDGIYKML